MAVNVKPEAKSCISEIPELFQSNFDKLFDVVCISAAAVIRAFVHCLNLHK